MCARSRKSGNTRRKPTTCGARGCDGAARVIEFTSTDLVLNIGTPDAKTCARMIRDFAGDDLAANADLSATGQILEGMIPACVQQAVDRAQLEALRRTDNPNAPMSGDDLAAAAQDVRNEFEMYRNNDDTANANTVGDLGKALSRAGEAVLSVAGTASSNGAH